MLLTAVNVQLLKNTFTILLVLFCIYVLSLIIRGITHFIQIRGAKNAPKRFKKIKGINYIFLGCKSVFNKVMVYTHMKYIPYTRYMIYDNTTNTPNVLLYVYLDLDDVKFFAVDKDLMGVYDKVKNTIFNNNHCISVRRTFITSPIVYGDSQYLDSVSEGALGRDFIDKTFGEGKEPEYYEAISRILNGVERTSHPFIGVEEVDNHGHFLEDPSDKLQNDLNEQLARKFNELKRELDENNEEE